jgi:hypothetical protein
MKRVFLLLLIIFTFYLSKPLEVSACQYDGACNTNTYDCTNQVGSFPGANKNGCNIYPQCQNKPCCAEITGNSFTICYQEKTQPIIPPICPAGTLGCACRSNAPVCDGTLTPISSGASCICSNQAQNPCALGSEECQCRSSAPRCDDGLREVNFALACTCKKYSFIPINNPWSNPCGDNNKLPTAIGCIDFTSTTGLTKSILTFAIGVGGGIAFLLMIFGSFMVMTSSGNPERQQAGKEMITSAIMGLLLILLSVFILQLIGVKILAIPGFL